MASPGKRITNYGASTQWNTNYPSRKRKELVIHTATSTNLNCIMLSKRSQAQKAIYCTDLYDILEKEIV